MASKSSTPAPKIIAPFVAREKEIARLRQLHARRKHVLILGTGGVGKTALVDQIKEELDLLVCPASEHFVTIFDSLEAQLGLTSDDLKLIQRKRRLLKALAGGKRTLVFDGVYWTTPKLSSFLECVMERSPMWICTRSEHPWDMGHFWTWLVRFEKIELQPLHLVETREFVSAAIEAKQIPRETAGIVEWLHHRSNGNPLILRELCEELALNSYDLKNPLALRRLDLDRRIHEMFPDATTSKKKGG